MGTQRFADPEVHLHDGAVIEVTDRHGNYAGTYRKIEGHWHRDEFTALDLAARAAIDKLALIVAMAAEIDPHLLTLDDDVLDLGEYATRSRDFGRGVTFAMREIRALAAARLANPERRPAPTIDPHRYPCIGCGTTTGPGILRCDRCRKRQP